MNRPTIIAAAIGTLMACPLNDLIAQETTKNPTARVEPIKARPEATGTSRAESTTRKNVKVNVKGAVTAVQAPKNASAADEKVKDIGRLKSDVQVEYIPSEGIVIMRGNAADVERTKEVVSKLTDMAVKESSKTSKRSTTSEATGLGGRNDQSIRVMNLKFITASDAIRIMGDLGKFEDCRITSDPSLTRLIYVANQEQAAQIEQLIHVIDVESENAPRFSALENNSNRQRMQGMFGGLAIGRRIEGGTGGGADGRIPVGKSVSISVDQIKKIDDPIADRRRQYESAEIQANDLAAAIRHENSSDSRDENRVKKLTDQLRQAVQSAFEQRLAFQLTQLDEAQSEIDASRKRLTQRQQNAKEIIQRRIKALTKD